MKKPTGGEAFSKAKPDGFTPSSSTPEFLTQPSHDLFSATKVTPSEQQISSLDSTALTSQSDTSFIDKIIPYLESRAGNI